MPDLVPPMQAVSGDLPTGPGWAVEFAWDGLRCIAYAGAGRARLLTARDRSVTATFPELGVLGDKAPRGGLVLDGTVVALDHAGIPSRRLLMRRTATQRPSPSLVAGVPVGFFVSDLLWLDGTSTTALPYRRRRELIDGLGLAEEPVVVSPSWAADDAGHLLRTAERYGLDGLYAKRLDAAYQPGRRTRNWLRVPLRRSRQVVVGGWTPADPRRPETVAALLLGVPGADGLRYVGRVGLGSGAERRAVTALLPGVRADISPFATAPPATISRDGVWAVPRLVGRVEFTDWTAGARLRLPVWRGLVGPDEVDEALWEDPGPVEVATPGRGSGRPERAPDPVGPGRAPDPGTAVEPASAAPPPGVPDRVLARRLEQHFVYNALNMIASLVRTDPPRARELLLGFADLARTADGPAQSILGRELDAVRAYLQLEQARFGNRLQVAVDVGVGLERVPVAAMQVLTVVRDAVQQGIEPLTGGGLLAVTARADDGGCVVTVTAAAGEPTVIVLPVTGTAVPSSTR